MTHILRDDLRNIDFKISSLYSPEVADAVQRREIDLGFCRVEPRPDVTYRVIAHEPIVAVLPSDHRLAAHAEIDPRELRDELFIGYSDTPHVLRDVVNKYLRKCGVKVTPSHYLDNFATGHFAGGLHSRDYAAAELRRTSAAVVSGEPETQG